MNSLTERKEPNRTKDLTDDDEESLKTPPTEQPLPSLAKFLRESELPSSRNLNTEAFEPISAKDRILKEEPIAR
jgi:hypothetical protein